MTEIVHTGKWPEPIVITFAQGIHSTQRNLLVGERTSCEDGQVSRELKVLERKGYVTLKQFPPAAPPISSGDDMTPEEIEKLEEELLNVDGRDAVSKEEE